MNELENRIKALENDMITIMGHIDSVIGLIEKINNQQNGIIKRLPL